MRRTHLALAVCTAMAATAALAEAPRRIQLEAPPPDGVRRFVSELKNLSVEAGSQTWETITRTGKFWDPRYGNFEITQHMLLQIVENFEKKAYGQDIFIDVAHKPDDGAAAKVVKLQVKDGKLRALLEWTPFGADAVVNRGFRYFSADYHENFQDNEHRQKHGTTLLGAGLTNRPVIKGLDPVDPSRIKLAQSDDAPPTLIHPDLQSHLLQEVHAMWKELIARLVKTLSDTHKLSEANVKLLSAQAETALAKITDKAVAEGVIAGFEGAGKQLAEALVANPNGPIVLNLSMGTAGLDEAGVKKLLEATEKARGEAAKQLAETTTARRKLLADTINAVTGIPEEDRKELILAVEDLVTADTTEDVVKRLAATQIASGNKLVAARQLAGLGYHVEGSPIITVEASNEIKALQEQVDKRLYTRMSPEKRYRLSEGREIGVNKALVEEALAQFDKANAHRLHREYQAMKLSGGDGVVADVAIPASFERTVLRESLYQLTGLPLCDVGTHIFAAVMQIPYSYRDTTAAGRSGTRKYQGQAISRAGVIQTSEDARPIPQKIAFEVSDELRYLVGNGQLNFDIVAENAANAVRIIGEDTEQVIYNEHLNASDEYAATAVVAEDLEPQSNGTNKVFVLAQWPVVTPRKVYDLAGSQVGSTVNPITVTYNSVAREEYDGTGSQASGTYYVLDKNLGEIYLVNQAGAIQTPADGTAYTISYSYTTNVKKFDMDEGELETDQKWDTFLNNFGQRRTVVEDRQHVASLATMSGVVRDLIAQARQFGANFKRTGTDLGADGNVGRIKDVPTYRSFAPGLQAGDKRIVIGERGTVRFRMMKGWMLNQLENQKDSNGRFTGKKEAYGDQFIVVHTPTQLKAGLTSMVLYSAAARIARPAP